MQITRMNEAWRRGWRCAVKSHLLPWSRGPLHYIFCGWLSVLWKYRHPCLGFCIGGLRVTGLGDLAVQPFAGHRCRCTARIHCCENTDAGEAATIFGCFVARRRGPPSGEDTKVPGIEFQIVTHRVRLVCEPLGLPYNSAHAFPTSRGTFWGCRHPPETTSRTGTQLLCDVLRRLLLTATHRRLAAG